MAWYDSILNNLPEVEGPTQKRLSFKEKLKWTLIILGLFFVLGQIALFGLGSNELSRFEFLSIILGAEFGSIISLGIGPLVTSSIVLQLLNGSGIIKFDLTTSDGKRLFQGVQKLLSIFFIIFEAIIYVFMGGLSPEQAFLGTPLYLQLQLILVFQLTLGGILIMFMDEVVSKWGFGSGISLFIAAGVSKSLFVRTFSWLHPVTQGVVDTSSYVGAIPELIRSLAAQDPQTAILMLSAIIATLLVFVISIYAQAMKIEIPLSFGRIRGHGIRWPLSFIYTSNIPVILVAALLANIQLWASLVQNWATSITSTGVMAKVANFLSVHIFGQANTVNSGHGLVQWVNPPDLVRGLITRSLTADQMWSIIGYFLIMIVGAVIFSIFWMQTAGMDAKSQAKQIMASGLQIPGFRKDQRVLERLLDRYIWPLTIMGAITVGFLAALADLTGALSRGTGILLTVMIVYKLYEEIAKQHMMDMHPMMRKFME
ncbi:MAG: preprotein translocase subunit SecY [Candidatus Woesearchaeota archaeon]